MSVSKIVQSLNDLGSVDLELVIAAAVKRLRTSVCMETLVNYQIAQEAFEKMEFNKLPPSGQGLSSKKGTVHVSK